VRNTVDVLKTIPKRVWLVVVVAFLFGALWTTALRFVLIEDKETHFHANYAIFIDGERLRLDSFTYYEEVATCAGDDLNNPKSRVHMHDRVDHVVHVHDHAATWGHLFYNLGFTIGNQSMNIENKNYLKSETLPFTFWVNGEEVDAVANRVIESEDVLLISVGTKDKAVLQQQYDAIQKDANEYNKRNDPSACKGGEKLDFWGRLEQAIGL
jgi:hypothetical protein